MMHVLFARGLEDRDYLERTRSATKQLRERAAEWTPARDAVGHRVAARRRSSSLGDALRHARSAAFIRVNYGLQRHAGGGMAVRNIACLPAITGHWRRAGGGVQLSTSANFTFNRAGARATRPRAAGAHDQHDPARRSAHAAGRRRRRSAGEGARRLQQQSGGRRARSQHGAARTRAARTCSPSCSSTSRPTPRDWADIVLPATTQLEHWDVHLAYGHHYVDAQPAVDRAARRGAAEQRRSSACSPRGWG